MRKRNVNEGKVLFFNSEFLFTHSSSNTHYYLILECTV